MHLHKHGFIISTNFYKLALTPGTSCIRFMEWIAEKKVVINQENNDEECFKWAVIAALYHEEMYILHCKSKPQNYEGQYN